MRNNNPNNINKEGDEMSHKSVFTKATHIASYALLFAIFVTATLQAQEVSHAKQKEKNVPSNLPEDKTLFIHGFGASFFVGWNTTQNYFINPNEKEIQVEYKKQRIDKNPYMRIVKNKEDAYFKDVINAKKYDYIWIDLNQCKRNHGGMENYFPGIVKMIESSGAKLGGYQNHLYSEKYYKVLPEYERMVEELVIKPYNPPFIGVMHAWLNADYSSVRPDDHEGAGWMNWFFVGWGRSTKGYGDGHANPYGGLIAGCLAYSALTGKSSVGLSLPLENKKGNLDIKKVRWIQENAWGTYNKLRNQGKRLPSIFGKEKFPSEGLNMPPKWMKSSDAKVGWHVDFSKKTAKEGYLSLSSDKTAKGENAGVTFFGQMKSGEVSFAVEVSSGDTLSFSVDNKLIETFKGTGKWEDSPKYKIEAGEHSLLWEYKNSSGDNGRARIDSVFIPSPTIGVYGNGQPICDAESDPAAYCYTDFGQAIVGKMKIIKTFAIRNFGDVPLTLNGTNPVEFEGEGSFEIIKMPAKIIPPHSAVHFDVAFTPAKEGTIETDIMIFNDDMGKHDPFNFKISGEGVSPKSERFPPKGEMPSGWKTSAGADAGWHVQYKGNDTIWKYFGEGGVNTFASEGVAFLEADKIESNQAASIEYAGEFVDGKIIFDYKTSSAVAKRGQASSLVFYIDGKKQDEWSGGQYNWRTATYPVKKGKHILKWSYEKNAGVANKDRVWIDKVVLPLAQ